MAAGDVVTNLSSVVATTGVLDIRPSAGAEWVIHNIYYDGGSVELYKTDGTNALKFDTDVTAGARLGAVFHCTNSQWIQMRNTSGVDVLMSYDGIQTK